MIEEKIRQVKDVIASLGNGKLIEEAAETCDFSYSSPKAATRRKISISPLSNGTASGGILKISMPYPPERQSLVPGFQVNNEEVHYNSEQTHGLEENSLQISETQLEAIGCCRSNFFCF